MTVGPRTYVCPDGCGTFRVLGGFEIDADNYREVIERRIGEAKRQREATVNQEATADD